MNHEIDLELVKLPDQDSRRCVNLYEKFQEKMNDDINRSHGGFFSSYSQVVLAFSSFGLSGEIYQWCSLLSE